jgi:hypothetical protein
MICRFVAGSEVLTDHTPVVLPIFPFIAWLAPLTSGGLLIGLWFLGDLRRPVLAVALGWFLLAGYCQFFWGSAVVAAIGVLAQTLLAVYLLIRWRLGYWS